MRMKHIIGGVLVAVAVSLILLSPQISSNPHTAQAAGNIQGFNIDGIECFGGTDPNPNVGPGGTWPMMNCSGENLTAGAVQGYTLAVSIEKGNRQGLPYEYVGPGWTNATDAQITDGSKVGDVTSSIDLLCDGTADKLADSSGASVPEPFFERTTNWGNNTGIGGKSELYLNTLLPPSAVMARTVRYRADIDTIWIGGSVRYALAVPSALNSVMMHPVWSPAGAEVTTILLGGDIAAPGQQLVCQDTPQSSLSHIYGQTPGGQQIQANPANPGLYVRWLTEISNPDAVTGQVTFSYTSYCKTVGPAVADNDNDCLSNADEAAKGTNPNVADTDGDGLIDGVEVAWGSDPTKANTDAAVVHGSVTGDGCSDLEEMVGPTQFLSNPTDPDTDADGVPDGCLKVNMATAAFNTDGAGRTRFTVDLKNGLLYDRFQAGGDNCPDIANPAQTNTDKALNPVTGDFYGDACDTDIDNDGIVNEAETGFFYDKEYNVCRSDGEDGLVDNKYRTLALTPLNPLNPDTDGDGIVDGRECELGSDPLDASSVVTRFPTDANGGPDFDGLSATYETGWRTQNFSQAVGLELTNIDGDAHLTGETDWDSDNDGLNDACELLTLNSAVGNQDQNGNGTLDGLEMNCNGKPTELPGGQGGPVPGAVLDFDSDGVQNYTDNCVNVANGTQTNTPLGTIDNGPGVPTGDTTCVKKDASVAFEDKLGDACDDDADNDLKPDGSDGDPGGALGVPNAGGFTLDTTYDDNCDGVMLTLGDDGPSWDANGDTVIDGATPPFTSTADYDGDGINNKVEVLGWGTDPANTNSDGDSMTDCTEIGDVDGGGSVTISDVIGVAKAALVTTPATQSGDLDLDKSGSLTISDVILSAKIALVSGFCPS